MNEAWFLGQMLPLDAGMQLGPSGRPDAVERDPGVSDRCRLDVGGLLEAQFGYDTGAESDQTT
ncbi:hypothetical protein [Streptomyces sp. NPDC000983]|uniref:hypothetical protein n=1 Tax=Streptomyces sp. NPDC000983 TaxID=3154373 RepID=UPI00332C7BAF